MEMPSWKDDFEQGRWEGIAGVGNSVCKDSAAWGPWKV